MLKDDQFDADEILRDLDEKKVDDDLFGDDDLSELEFGTKRDERTHYKELASDLDNAEDMWS